MNKSIKTIDTKLKRRSHIPHDISCHDRWWREYNGLSIFTLLAKYPKMTFNEIHNILYNEGGCIDENGLIRKR